MSNKQGMSCIVVGGCAGGVVLPDIRLDAEVIELARPDYIKPLLDAHQTAPEIAKEKDIYHVHPITLLNENDEYSLFGVAVVDGKELPWAFTELCRGYADSILQSLTTQGHITTN